MLSESLRRNVGVSKAAEKTSEALLPGSRHAKGRERGRGREREAVRVGV
jgi:hypothetical protein